MTAPPTLPEALAMPGSAAAVVAWRALGQLQLTVIAKATFAFARDQAMTRVDPQEILRAEVHHGNNPGRSIRSSTDLAPFLGRVDVLFTGSAHAPPGGPAQGVSVRLAIFTREHMLLDKTLEAHDPGGFERMPLVYERARGGIGDQENPVGTSAPGVVDPAHLGAARPAGFGPISRTWPARKRLLGETPRRVLDGAIAEIPAGFEWSYFQAAPPDQQVEELHGDEWILLDGLQPAASRLQMRLPGAVGRARIHGLADFGVPEGEPLSLRLDTVRLDGDEGRCTLVWRQSLPLADVAALAAARIVVGVEMSGAPLAWPDELPERRPEAARPEIPERAATSVRIESIDVEPDVESEPAPVLRTLMTHDEATGPSQPTLPFLPAKLAAPTIPLVVNEPTAHLPSGTLSIGADPVEDARRPVVPFLDQAAKVTNAPFMKAVPAPALPASQWSGAAPAARSAGARTASPWTGAAPLAAAAVAPALVAALPLSALEASNAAADAQRTATDASAAAGELAGDWGGGGDVLELIWFDPKILPRVRKQPAWRDLLDGLADKPHDPDIDAPGLDESGVVGEDRRAVFEILTHARPLGPTALRAALKGAIRADRRFVAPLVLLAGELSFLFDELESLKALAAAAGPFASGDATLQGAIEGARELLKTPDQTMVPEVVEGATARIRDAYGKSKRALPLTEIVAQAESALLKQRRYQQRTLLGGPQLRALLRLPDAREPIPAYLPASLAASLPMYQRFEARILCEAQLAADQHEAHPVALRVSALARSSAPAHTRDL